MKWGNLGKQTKSKQDWMILFGGHTSIIPQKNSHKTCAVFLGSDLSKKPEWCHWSDRASNKEHRQRNKRHVTKIKHVCHNLINCIQIKKPIFAIDQYMQSGRKTWTVKWKPPPLIPFIIMFPFDAQFTIYTDNMETCAHTIMYNK